MCFLGGRLIPRTIPASSCEPQCQAQSSNQKGETEARKVENTTTQNTATVQIRRKCQMSDEKRPEKRNGRQKVRMSEQCGKQPMVSAGREGRRATQGILKFRC